MTVFADHGELLSAVPFFAPMLAIVLGIAFMALRDRARRR